MSRVVVGKVDVFDPRFDARIIPVNCVGVMGKGLAKEAAKRYPESALYYKRRCSRSADALALGTVPLTPGDVAGYYEGPSVWFAATKDHWRDPSRGSWVLACAETIARRSAQIPGSSVVVPALGCGLGGLPWSAYGPAIEHALSRGPDDVTFYLCPPGEP